jgi:hypothetical protein
VSAQFQTVHVRVNDAATGQPTPVLIRFTGPDGTDYAPFGRLTGFATGRGEDVGGHDLRGSQRSYYIDGTCEIRLPVGPVRVIVLKGPEYTPLCQQVSVGPGMMTLRLSIERWADLRQEGWFAGDPQAFFLSPHAALLEAAAEDLTVVNLLACHEVQDGRPPSLPNLLAFSGQRPALEMPGHMVVVNTLNEHPVLGRLALLNSHRVVYPLRFGGPDGCDDWTLADWCDQCHRKGGLVVSADFFRGERWRRGEILADLLLGKIDALDVGPSPDDGPALSVERLEPWYRLLNGGLRVPLVGGSGKDRNIRRLGALRTYARLPSPGEFTYAAWVEAVRAGRTFVAELPALLDFTVNGQGPGAFLEMPAAEATVRVRATARAPDSTWCVEVLANGRVVARGGPPASGEKIKPSVLEADVPLPDGGWLAARCKTDSPQVCSHTSPVYVGRVGKSSPVSKDTVAWLADHLDEMLRWVDQEGRFENDKQKQRLAGIFRSAKEVLAVAFPASAPL